MGAQVWNMSGENGTSFLRHARSSAYPPANQSFRFAELHLHLRLGLCRRYSMIQECAACLHSKSRAVRRQNLLPSGHEIAAKMQLGARTQIDTVISQAGPGPPAPAVATQLLTCQWPQGGHPSLRLAMPQWCTASHHHATIITQWQPWYDMRRP